MKTAAAIAEILKREGVEVLIGYPVNPIIEAAAVADIRTIMVRQERIGLHMADVEKLILVLHRLVEAGNSVIVIEHNLDIIAEADWIIDLGPEGGDGGGKIVMQGTPEDCSATRGSHTAAFLREFLRVRRSHL